MIEEIIRIATSLRLRNDYFNDIEGALVKLDAVFRELKQEFEDILKEIRDSPLYFTYTSGSSIDHRSIQVSVNERLIDSGRITGSMSLNSSEDKAQSCSEKLQLEEAIKIIVSLPSRLNLISQEDLFEMDLLFRQHNIIGQEEQQITTKTTYVPLSEPQIRSRPCWMFILATAMITTIVCLTVIKLVVAHD